MQFTFHIKWFILFSSIVCVINSFTITQNNTLDGGIYLCAYSFRECLDMVKLFNYLFNPNYCFSSSHLTLSVTLSTIFALY